MGSMETMKEQQQRKEEERALLHYPFAAPDADASIVQVTDHVYWARMPMPLSLNHINVYLLEDDDGWYLVDTGLSTEDTRALWKKIAEQHFGDKPVKGIICTHFHYDHAGLAGWLMEHFNAPLYMSHGEYFTMRTLASNRENVGTDLQKGFYRKAGMPMETIDKMFHACRKDPFMKDYPPSFRRLREGDVISIKGKGWRVVIGEGHSPEHVCLYNEADGLLIAGDQLLPEISSNVLVHDIEPDANPLALWIASLNRLLQLKASTTVLPSHGPVFRNPHIRINQLLQHHERQCELIRSKAQIYQQFTAYDALRWMFDRKLSPVEVMLAQGEALAHLAWLRSNNDFKIETADDGVDRYSVSALTA